VTSTIAPAGPASARRDFGLLWTGQSLSLLGDQFLLLTLPLLAVTLLGVSPATAALLNFALFLPFLPLGLPAGALVDRWPRRTTMMIADGVQLVSFAAIGVLAATGRLGFGLLVVLIAVSGSAVVFFQVAYTSYLPSLFPATTDLQRGNTRLALSESASKAIGPMLAGPVIALVGVVGAVAVNTASFAASVLSLALVRHREPARAEVRSARMRHEIAAGLRFAASHPVLQPVLACGTTYVIFLSMVETSLVLYLRNVLHLSPQWIGIVIGSAAAGYPIGNLLSTRLVDRFGAPRALMVAATVSVTGIVAMPAFGSFGGSRGAAGLVLGSIVHCIGEGAFNPASVTVRQTATPAVLLGRTNGVQRFLLAGAVALGALLAAGATATIGLAGTVWVGAVGTVLCLPALARRGVLAALLRR
jgi:MFS family permease